MQLRRLFSVLFITALMTFCLLVSPHPAAASPALVPVIVTGGADACIFTFNGGPGNYSCTAGGIVGSLTFDTLTNSSVGPWSVSWAGYVFSGNANTVVSGSSLANDQFDFRAGRGFGFMVDDLQLVFDCPVGNGGDFCSVHGGLIPVPTPEPRSIILFGTGVLALLFYSECGLLVWQKAPSRRT